MCEGIVICPVRLCFCVCVCVGEEPAHDQQQVLQKEPAAMAPPLGELVRGLQHLHQESVNRRVPDEFEEEQMLQALQANGA